jgi:hypothetical protein
MRSSALFLLLAVVALASGCTTHNYAKVGNNVDVVQFANVEAGLEVGQPVEAQVQVTEIFGFIKLGMPNEFADGVSYGAGGGGGGLLSGIMGPGTAELAKSAAAYKALKGGEYDVLLGARYYVKTDWFLVATKYDVTVKGTGAKVTGFTQTH